MLRSTLRDQSSRLKDHLNDLIDVAPVKTGRTETKANVDISYNVDISFTLHDCMPDELFF